MVSESNLIVGAGVCAKAAIEAARDRTANEIVVKVFFMSVFYGFDAGTGGFETDGMVNRLSSMTGLISIVSNAVVE